MRLCCRARSDSYGDARSEAPSGARRQAIDERRCGGSVPCVPYFPCVPYVPCVLTAYGLWRARQICHWHAPSVCHWGIP